MRKIIWFDGCTSWCSDQTRQLISALPENLLKIIYCGTDKNIFASQQININVTTRRAEIEQYLGTQCNVFIINSYSGFNPELFCALCGTVQSPGLIILMSPPSNLWHSYPDPDYLNICSYPHTQFDISGRFVRYFINKLNQHTQAHTIIHLSEENQTGPSITSLQTSLQNFFSTPVPEVSFKLTPLHKQIINCIRDQLRSKKPSILLLSGQRGRGKSSVLGLALKDFANNQPFTVSIALVSQTRSNVMPILRQLSDNNSANITKQFNYKSLSLTTYPPDEILILKPDIDLLIIDEAASIPLPQLFQMLKLNHNTVFSTTTDGYEGTGMGFKSKLADHLANSDHSVTQINLTRPLRWPDGDPVEAFLQSSLLIHKHEHLDAIKKLQLCTPEYKQLDRETLISQPNLIDQLYSLLSTSHYRTTPDDLRYMLDAPDIELWVVQMNGIIVAAMMVGLEGNIPEKLSKAIWLGQRRVQGHLISQNLTSQCGFIQASQYRLKRILRIAVYESMRNQRLGTNLVNHVLSQSSDNLELDFYGVSFGYESRLYKFWNKLGFVPVKLGYRANARSGAKSLIMLNALSCRAKLLSQNLQQRSFEEIEYSYKSMNTTIDASLVQIFKPLGTIDRTYLDETQDKLDLYSFAFGNRQFAHCHSVLSRYTNQYLNNSAIRKMLSQSHQQLLSLKILQNKNWTYCAENLNLTGKKQAQEQLRLAVQIIYNAQWGNKS